MKLEERKNVAHMHSGTVYLTFDTFSKYSIRRKHKQKTKRKKHIVVKTLFGIHTQRTRTHNEHPHLRNNNENKQIVSCCFI